MINLTDVLLEVYDERKKQDAKWGQQNHGVVGWLAILAEEFGEVAMEVNEIYFRGKAAREYREELIQTAAVCVAMIESLDRGNV